MPQLPDFEAWAIFAKVAERGSFSQAADELGLGKTTVSKAITRLEERMRTTLLHRTTRRLSLTESGKASLERALRILADGEAVEAEILEDAAIPRGLVRLACMGAFGVRTLAPLLPEFMTAYPEVEIDLHIADDPVDMIGGGFDMAIRLGPAPDSSMRISRLVSIPVLVVASPAYFEKHGRPGHPSDLAHMPTLDFSHILLGPEWSLAHAEHGRCEVRVNARIRFNNAAAALPVVVAGHAISPDAADLHPRRAGGRPPGRCASRLASGAAAGERHHPAGQGATRARASVDRLPAGSPRQGAVGAGSRRLNLIGRRAATVKRRRDR